MRFILTALFMFHAALLYADTPRVVVSLFESKPEDSALARKASVISAEEVVRSEEPAYISPTDFVRAMLGKNSGTIVKRPLDLEREYSEKNLKELEEFSKPYQDDPDSLSRMLKAANIVVGGKIGHKGGLVAMELMAARMKDYREYSAIVETTESNLDAELRKAVAGLLKKASRVEKIYADKLTDPELSKVIYMVKSTDGKDIIVETDYTGDRPNPELQEVVILPPEGLNKDGVTVVDVMSREGKVINIEFSYKLGNLKSIRVDMPIPDPSSKAEQSEILIVRSVVGYLLNFEFVWKDGYMQSVKIEPKVNPFSDFD